MKKVILVVAALVLVISGVAAVSAYEAHLINVHAKVENAVAVDVSRFNFGTVFPEEFLLKDFNVGTSGSFCQATQTRVRSIDYQIWVEWKTKTDPDGIPRSGDETYYPWLGDALWLRTSEDGLIVDTNGDGKINLADDFALWTNIGDPPTGPPGVKWVMGPYTLRKPAPGSPDNHAWKLALDVPVFREYYNKITDVNPKPSGLSEPTVIIEKEDTDRYHPDGVELGVDLKIQVVRIYEAWP